MSRYRREIPLSGKSSQELYDRISNTIDEFIDQIPSKHVQLEKDPEQKKVSLEAKGVSALLFCQEEKLVIEAEFGWILRAFQSKIDQGIDRWLDHAMGGTKSLKSGAKE